MAISGNAADDDTIGKLFMTKGMHWSNPKRMRVCPSDNSDEDTDSNFAPNAGASAVSGNDGLP